MLTSGEKCKEDVIVSFIDFCQLVWGLWEGKTYTLSKRYFYGECHHHNFCHDFIL